MSNTQQQDGQCLHINKVDLEKEGNTIGCEECEKIGSDWVHLRLCLTCGHVGCCDSSPNKHGTKHYHNTKHPIIKSYEPGEDWKWCYVDKLMMEQAKTWKKKGRDYIQSEQQNNPTKHSKPKILPLPNGPFYSFHNMKPKVVENLQNSKGESLQTVRGVDLCRYGASKNKPFCDGTHNTINFSTADDIENSNTDGNNISKSKKKSYIGQRITVHDNRSICSHAVICVENLPSVFKVGNRPWINMDNANVEEIIETIKECPSGALSYSIDGIEYKEINDREPMITISKDGPYLITGGIELLGEKQIVEGASKEHYALCRCGASKNKPFCDGSHYQINFKDDKN